ncbi:MAG TPA: hypothetical protein VF708_18435 [Pyrinomonadaceae bacterium]
MNQLSIQSAVPLSIPRIVWKATFTFFVLLLAAMIAHAQDEALSPRVDDAQALEVSGVEEGDVFGLGKSVIISGTVKKGVIAFGGDVTVAGRVEGDVASIGGSVIQREGSYIGGDVWVFGGAYHHGKSAPGRNPESTTIMYAGYEQELRELMRDPSTLLMPRWSLAYLGQRLLAVLFWFIVSLALTAATPGAVSRAMTRLQLTSLRVAVIGFLGSIMCSFGVLACLRVLPTVVSAFVGIMALLLLIVAYLFGRVVIHAATGRWLQHRFLPEGKRSESVALLLGASVWAVILSLPYVWPLVVAGLLVTSLGLALTARYRLGWKRTQSI